MIVIVNKILSVLTVFSQVSLVFGLIAIFIFSSEQTKKLRQFLSQNALILAFIVALVSTLFSLFYSDVAGFTPCWLCWYQRIFMYPQVFILGLALWRKDNNIVPYSLLLAIVGGIISAYHNYGYYFNTSSLPCPANGASCAVRYVYEFGYITIPLMALTAFILIGTLLLLRRNLVLK